MKRILLVPAALAAVLALPASVKAQEHVPGEVVVRYEGATRSVPVEVEPGQSVQEAVAELQEDPGVAYARPNYVAHASALIPNDPNIDLQWNLFGQFGLGMPEAWELAIAHGAPGGRDTVVAVLDTGVAYRNRGPFRRAPDLHHFVRGHDFVDNDRYPFDLNGHGTHVAGTIAQSTNNGRAVAGIAYRAKIMPLRVLDADGAGDTIAISRAIRYAARRRAHVINLSLEFDSSVRASQIPDIVSALRYARRRGVVVTAAAGNQADGVVAYPARASSVIAVGATTERGCLADYSNGGRHLDVVAPGGGVDSPPPLADGERNEYDDTVCKPDARGRDIFQQTFTRSVRNFGLPGGYEGTSMAAPHVAGVAALVIGSRRIGGGRNPRGIEQHLETTARDLGLPGFDVRYGNGLVDAAAALR